MSAESATAPGAGQPARIPLRSREFLGPVTAIGGVALMAAMDGPVAVFALPTIQEDLGLSDTVRMWVITAYLLTFGGLILVGGRLGDTLGRRRTYIAGVAGFTIASAFCAVAWDGAALVGARLLHGAAAAVVAPTCMALVATTFPKGPARNAATAVLGATASVGAVLGLVLGGVLTTVSWRLAFAVNVPLGLLVIHLARRTLRETGREPLRLDAAGAVLATVACTAAVLALSAGSEGGGLSRATIGWTALAVVTAVAFVLVERTAVNPIVPLSLFADRSRLATFAAMFLARGVGFSLTVVIALYVQNIMGFPPLTAGVAFVPFAVAMAIGTALSAQLSTRFAPRVLIVVGSAAVLAAMLWGSTLTRGATYFPDLVVPMAIGAAGLGLINVPLGLSLIASVGVDRIGPTSALAVMVQSLGGPLVLAAVQVVITAETLRNGGATGPVSALTETQLEALDTGYSHGLLALTVFVALLGAVSLFMGYSARDVAHAQTNKTAYDYDHDGP